MSNGKLSSGKLSDGKSNNSESCCFIAIFNNHRTPRGGAPPGGYLPIGWPRGGMPGLFDLTQNYRTPKYPWLYNQQTVISDCIQKIPRESGIQHDPLWVIKAPLPVSTNSSPPAGLGTIGPIDDWPDRKAAQSPDVGTREREIEKSAYLGTGRHLACLEPPLAAANVTWVRSLLYSSV